MSTDWLVIAAPDPVLHMERQSDTISAQRKQKPDLGPYDFTLKEIFLILYSVKENSKSGP